MKSANAIRPLLQRIGLDEKEIEVYLALLALKSARVRDIAIAAKQTRSHTYDLLRQLQKRGLVSAIERGKVLHFIAEQPGKLVSYLEERTRELMALQPLVQSIVPMLSSLSRPLPGQPRVTFLHGRDGMLQIYTEALAMEYRAFMNAQMLFSVFPENLPPLALKRGKKLLGRDLIVDNAAAKKALRDYPPQPKDGYDARLLPKSIQYPAEAIIYGDVVAFFAYDDERTSLRIENHNMAEMMGALFESLWMISRTVDG